MYFESVHGDIETRLLKWSRRRFSGGESKDKTEVNCCCSSEQILNSTVCEYFELNVSTKMMVCHGRMKMLPVLIVKDSVR